MGLMGWLSILLIAAYGFCGYHIAQSVREGQWFKGGVLLAGLLMFTVGLFYALICFFTSM